jgi:hypothetical protein
MAVNARLLPLLLLSVAAAAACSSPGTAQGTVGPPAGAPVTAAPPYVQPPPQPAEVPLGQRYVCNNGTAVTVRADEVSVPKSDSAAIPRALAITVDTENTTSEVVRTFPMTGQVHFQELPGEFASTSAKGYDVAHPATLQPGKRYSSKELYVPYENADWPQGAVLNVGVTCPMLDSEPGAGAAANAQPVTYVGPATVAT